MTKWLSPPPSLGFGDNTRSWSERLLAWLVRQEHIEEPTPEARFIGISPNAPPYNAGWRQYAGGSGFVDLHIWRHGNIVGINGIFQALAGGTNTVFSIPAEYQPKGTLIVSGFRSGAIERIDVANGSFNVSTKVTNNWYVCNVVYLNLPLQT